MPKPKTLDIFRVHAFRIDSKGEMALLAIQRRYDLNMSEAIRLSLLVTESILSKDMATISEIAEYLKVPLETIQRWIQVDGEGVVYAFVNGRNREEKNQE